tara:strand:- start:2508 stop:3035 length:528 start_codon:yes stop_codon:yes gene_type:complete
MIFKTDELKSLFINDDRKIIICNHFIPFIDGLWLHKILSNEEINHFIYMSNCFNYNNSWLRSIKTPNFVCNEVKYLKSLNNYCAVIFPSGGTIEWKSGFYYLSKKSYTPIYICYLNYIDKRIEIIGRVTINESSNYKTVKEKCLSIYKNKVKIPVWCKYLKVFNYGDEIINKNDY